MYYSVTPQTRGIRNNNPFNIIRSNSEWLGKIPHKDSTDVKFEQFESMELGVRAGVVLLRNYVRNNNPIFGRRNTISKIINSFAPSVENESERYIDFVRGYGYSVPVSRDLQINYPSLEFAKLCCAILFYESQYEVPLEHIYYIINHFKLY